jgi:hypothetical protein
MAASGGSRPEDVTVEEVSGRLQGEAYAAMLSADAKARERDAALQATLEAGFDGMAAAMGAQGDAMVAQMDARGDAIISYVDARHDAADARSEARYDAADAKIDALAGRVDALAASTTPSALPSIRSDLIRAYLEGFGEMERAFSSRDSESHSIEDMYVGLAMLSEEEFRKGSQGAKDAKDSKGFEEPEHRGGARVPLEELFERAERTGKGSGKHVFIEGAPGSGKSTMCQFMAHAWAKNSLFSEFAALVWIPLREWEARSEQGACSLAQFMKEKYSLSATAEEIELVLQNDQKNMLIVMDGYDELHNNTFRKRVLDFLKLNPNWILTSRPNYQKGIRYDAGFELIGFDAENRERFIRKYFAEDVSLADESVGASESKASAREAVPGEVTGHPKAEKLMTSLRQNKRLAEMARIPILLELLCFCCEAKGDMIDRLLAEGRITELYALFNEKLSKRYLVKFKEKDDSIDASLVARYTETERLFLEEVALQGVIEGRIYLTSDMLKKALATVRVKNPDFIFNEILQQGLLKVSAQQTPSVQPDGLTL